MRMYAIKQSLFIYSQYISFAIMMKMFLMASHPNFTFSVIIIVHFLDVNTRRAVERIRRKMSVTNYQLTLCNIPEDRRSHLHRGGSLKSRKKRKLELRSTET
jgi:hypothetical protein